MIISPLHSYSYILSRDLNLLFPRLGKGDFFLTRIDRIHKQPFRNGPGVKSVGALWLFCIISTYLSLSARLVVIGCNKWEIKTRYWQADGPGATIVHVCVDAWNPEREIVLMGNVGIIIFLGLQEIAIQIKWTAVLRLTKMLRVVEGWKGNKGDRNGTLLLRGRIWMGRIWFVSEN